MKLHELPYFSRFFEAPDFSFDLIGAGNFVDQYVSYSQQRPEWAMSFMTLLLDAEDAFTSVASWSSDPDTTEQCRRRYGQLAKGLAEALRAEERVMLPYALYQIRRVFRLSHSLSSMRRAVAECCGADDEDECEYLFSDELNLVECDHCNELEFSDYTSSAYGRYDTVCRACIEDHCTWLDRYDEYVLSDEVRDAIDEDGEDVSICLHDGNFVWDSGLRTYRHVDYEEEDEEEEEEPSVIQSYHSSKRLQWPQADDWTAKHNRFFGVELEVEVHNNDSEFKARQLHEAINDQQMGNKVFFERDGSVPSGFEIISQPMSLPAQRQLWSWLNNKELTKHLKSHNTSTCGLHVHVSRDGLTPLQIAKIVAFVNAPDNEPLIFAIARRYAEGYCRIKDKSKIGKAHQSDDRYEAVNVTNSKTIEFRVFKGSLKYESIVAAIEFANSMVEFTRPSGECSVSNLKADAFLEFIEKKMAAETKVLRNYITTRLENA